MIDVWKAAAPTIDALALNIYSAQFREHCADYTRDNNLLLIPEARNEPAAAARALYAFGRHGAIMFTPFGIDDPSNDQILAETYRLLSDMIPLLTQIAAADCTGFLQQTDDERFEDTLGNYRVIARCRRKYTECEVPDAAMILRLGQDEFIVVGFNLVLTFEPLNKQLYTAEIVQLETGDFHNGMWTPSHRLNGDETYHGTSVLLNDTLSSLRFYLHAFE